MRFLLILTVFLASAGCNDDHLREFCSVEVPAWFAQVAAADAKIAGGGRMPASADSAAEQVDWTDWAERRLKEAQHAGDLVSQGPGNQWKGRLFSDLATDLVTFHGYAQQRKTERMSATLARVLARRAEIEKKICAPAI